MARKKKEPDKLALDAAAALAAGMTYGKWKAMQSNLVTIEKKIPDGWIACQYCGKPFKPRTRTHRYCEFGCREQDYNERMRKKNTERIREWRGRKKAETAE